MGEGIGQAVEIATTSDRAAATLDCVVLIRPPIVIFPRSLSSYGPVPPIGLAYIAAALRSVGHGVQVIDGSGEAIDRSEDFETPVGTLRRIGLSPSEIVERIPSDVQLIGITHMFLHEWPHVREIARLARDRFPDVPIVLGGENATAFTDGIFEESDAVDACVLGEGERVIVEVAGRIALGLPYGDVAGVAVRSGSGEIDNNGLAVRIRHLSELPRPAWDLFPLENYWKYSDFFGVHRGRSIPVLGTRGCPYKCSFCSSPQMWTTRYAVRDVEDLVDEIEDYVIEYGVENVNFCDLTAVTKRQWTLDFCDALERRGLKVDFQIPVGTRIEALDGVVLKRLHQAGLRYLTFAPESGSQRMLEIYDKRNSLEKIGQGVRDAHQVGLNTRVNIIIGHPEERWSDTLQSLKFLVRTALDGCDDAAVIMFCAYPGSADFRALVESGAHVMDEAAYYVGLSRAASGHKSYNPRMSSLQLRIAQLVMVAIFYGVGLLRYPRRLAGYVGAQRSGRERTFLDQLLRIKRRGFEPSAPDTAGLS